MPNLSVSLSQDDLEKLASLQKGSFQIGPLAISWSLDMSIPQFIADASLFGVSIGHVVIDPKNPKATLGGNIGIAQATVTLDADFAARHVEYDLEVIAFGKHLLSKKGILWTW